MITALKYIYSRKWEKENIGEEIINEISQENFTEVKDMSSQI